MDTKTEEIGNQIFVGDKPIMKYVSAVIYQLTENKQNEVVIKSRGKYNARAIDIVLIAITNFLKDVVVKDIKISNLDVVKEKKNIRVSVLSITVEKKVTV